MTYFSYLNDLHLSICEWVLINIKDFNFASVSDFIDFIEKESYLVSPLPVTLKMNDNSDIPFIEVALYRNIPVITGNKRHFNINFNIEGVQKLVVYSPKEFLNHFIL